MSVKHLDELCLISPVFHIWSGQTKLEASDLKLGDGGALPPDKIAQLGSKNICDPQLLTVFNSIKTSCRRAILSYGMKFLGSFIVPLSKLDTIINELERIKAEFNTAKRAFLDKYYDALEEWIAENKEYEAAIRAGALSADEVEMRISFDYQIITVSPAPVKGSKEKLEHAVSGLGDELIQEIVDEASDFYHRLLKGKKSCAVKSLARLVNMRNKLDGLSFLDNSFRPLVDMLSQALSLVSKYDGKKSIPAPDVYIVHAAALIMSSRDSIEAHTNGDHTLTSQTSDLCSDDELLVTLATLNDEPQSDAAVGDTAAHVDTPDTVTQASDKSAASTVVANENLSIDGELDDLDAFLAEQGIGVESTGSVDPETALDDTESKVSSFDPDEPDQSEMHDMPILGGSIADAMNPSAGGIGNMPGNTIDDGFF